jgi:O-methyltransferase
VPGGLVVLDDYGWNHYPRQQTSADAFFASHAHRAVELPTGQGLVIKR